MRLKHLKVFIFILSGIFFGFIAKSQVSETYNSAGTINWVCPAGVTSVTVECWGGGGGGADANNGIGGGGGGGGAYAKTTNIAVTGGTTYSIVVGRGGTSDGLISATSTTFGLTTVVADYGRSATGNPGAVGGSDLNSTGEFKYSGGTGGSGINADDVSGGGGGSAGPNGIGLSGNNGAANVGGNGGSGNNGLGGAGGAGGNGVNGGNGTGNVLGGGGGGGGDNGKRGGNAGSPGAGGGGGETGGGTGADGQVVLTYTCDVSYSITGTSASSPVSAGTSSTVTLTGNIAELPEGVYTVTYNLSAPNAATGLTASMTVNSFGVGTFTTASLVNAGVTTISVTDLESGSCNNAVGSNNTANITVDISYCTPASTGTGFPITNVNFVNINNSTSNPAIVYEDFTSIISPAIVLKGSTYSLSISAIGLAPNTFYGNVFFDWNHDGDFSDAGEQIDLGSFTTTDITYSGNITIPLTAATGITRMRVMHKYFSYSTSCYNGTNNLQVEDYDINILPVGTTTITAGAGTESLTIPSLTDTQAEAILLNFDFTINDDGILPATDINPTLFSALTIFQGTGNDITNWTEAFAGAILSDGTNTQSVNVSINTSNILFSSIPYGVGELGYISDNSGKTYTLSIWFKTSLGGILPATIDGLNFVFEVNNSSFQFETGSSYLAAGQTQNSGNTNNEVTVTATQLTFTGQPANTASSGVALSVQPIVNATDENKNTDTDINTLITLSNTGSLTINNNSMNFVSGIADFGIPNNFMFTSGGEYVMLTASDGTLQTSIPSIEIAVDIEGCDLFAEDFESYSAIADLNQDGAAWDFLEITASVNDWGIGSSSGNNSLTIYNGNNAFEYQNDNDAQQIAYYAIPIDARNYKNLTLAFDWQSNGEADYDFGTVVWTDGDPTVASNWAIAEPTRYNGQGSFTSTVIDLSVCDARQFYIGFRWINDNSIGTNPPFAVDNIVIKGFPKFDYNFSYRQDTYEAITGTVATPDAQKGANISLPAGFDFSYDGSAVSVVRANINGWLQMGNSYIADAAPVNKLSDMSNVPFLAPFWDNLSADGQSKIIYKVAGVAPSRIFTIEWRDVLWGAVRENFQVKLYETSYVIEFWYGTMNTNAAGSTSIGINNFETGSCMNRLISITPGSVPLASFAAENNTINSATYLNSGMVYIFNPLVMQSYKSWQTADIVIGQADWAAQLDILDQSTTRNASSAGISSKNVLAVGQQGYGLTPPMTGGRVLLWNSTPTTNGEAADVVLGKPNFTDDTGGCSATVFNSVNGVCFSPDGEKLIVVDYGNNRVLIYNTIPTDMSGAPYAADVVIGQPDFVTNSAGTTSERLSGPLDAIVLPSGKLLISDSGNNRVLIYNSIPQENGQAADVVIGQTDFVSNSTGTSATKLNGPWGLSYSPDGRLFIADRMNERILVFNDVPLLNGVSADQVIGQSDFTGTTTGTSAEKYNRPLGVTISPEGKMAVCEFFNHRTLVYEHVPATNGGKANYVLGQPNYGEAYEFNDGMSQANTLNPDNRNMRYAYATRFDLNGRLLVVGRDMERVMLYGNAPTETADLEVSIIADGTNICVYADVEYTVAVTNHGGDAANSIVVNAQLPVGFIPTGYDASIGTYNEKSGYWMIPYISVNETVTLHFRGEVQPSLSGVNVVAYANIVASKQADSDFSNNGANEVVAVRSFYAPTSTDFVDQYINRNSHTIPVINFTVNDLDGLGDISTYTCTSSNTTLLPLNYTTNLIFAGTEPYKTLDIYPAHDEYGYSDMSVIITDSHGCFKEYEFTVAVGNIWEGDDIITGTKWDAPENWSSGSAPDSNLEAIIPTNPIGGFFPIIDVADAECYDLIIQPKASVTLNDTYTLHVFRDFTIESDITGSGSFTDFNSAGFNQVTIDGDIYVQRYVSNDAWHYLSSPLTGVTNKVLTENVCGANYNGNVLDYNEAFNSDYDGDSDIDWFDGWEWPWYYTQNNNPLIPANGYAYYTYSGTCTNTVEFTGLAVSLNTGNYSYTVTNQDETYSPTGFGPHRGWNLVGNPYASGVNADIFLSANSGVIDQTVYLWDENGGTGFNAEGTDYATYNATLGGTVGTGGGSVIPDEFISNGQSFFVHKTSSTPTSATISFSNSMRDVENSFFFKNKTLTQVPKIKLSVTNSQNMINEIIIGFIDDATEDFDPKYDAYKMEGNPKLAFYTKLNGKNLVTQGLPEFNKDNTRIIPLGINAQIQGEYVIDLRMTEYFPEGVNVFLEDLYLNTIINLTESKKYIFMIENSERIDDRFRLVLNPNNSPELIIPIPDIFIDEDASFSYILDKNTFADSDENDQLTVQIFTENESLFPQWLHYNPKTNLLFGIPENKDVGVYNFKAVATDLFGAKATDLFTITVNNTNDEPVLNLPINDVTLNVFEEFEVKIPKNTFYDEDFGDVLIYNALQSTGFDLPQWLKFSSEELKFYGTPGKDAAGIYTIRLSATDKGGLSCFDEFEITVNYIAGMQNINYENIKLYPNPSTGIFNIEAEDYISQYFEITDISGKIIERGIIESSKQTIDISKLSNGVYYFSILYQNIKIPIVINK